MCVCVCVCDECGVRAIYITMYMLCEYSVRNKSLQVVQALSVCVCVCVCACMCVSCVCIGVYNSCTCTLCDNSVRNKNQCHCK